MSIIGMIDAVGALAFLAAFFIALRNYRETQEVSSYWLIMSLALFLGFLWASAISLEWFGFYPDLIDTMETSLASASITAFAMAAVLTSEELIKAVG